MCNISKTTQSIYINKLITKQLTTQCKVLTTVETLSHLRVIFKIMAYSD